MVSTGFLSKRCGVLFVRWDAFVQLEVKISVKRNRDLFSFLRMYKAIKHQSAIRLHRSRQINRDRVPETGGRMSHNLTCTMSKFG